MQGTIYTIVSGSTGQEPPCSLRGASSSLPIAEDLSLASSGKLAGSFSCYINVLREGMGQKKPGSAGTAKARPVGTGMF